MNRQINKSTIIMAIMCGCILIFILIWFGVINVLLMEDIVLIDGRPAERLVDSVLSPDGSHRMDVYCNLGSATVANSSTIIITAINNSEKWKNKEAWCVYWVYAYSDVEAQWIDKDTIKVINKSIPTDNNEVKLNIYQNEFVHSIS